MVATPLGATLRRQRLEAGLSQRQLALRSSVPQPNISAYERGRRTPTADTLERLGSVLNVPILQHLHVMREPILRAAAGRRLSDVRVFGSVARGEAGASSDIDLLVHPGPDASVFDLAGFMAEVEELLGREVDVVSDRGSGLAMDRIRDEAVSL